MELKPPLNMVLYDFDKSEYNKNLYVKNKEKILEQHKAYNEQNKVKVKCECGSIVRKLAIARHKKSKKHKSYIDKM